MHSVILLCVVSVTSRTQTGFRSFSSSSKKLAVIASKPDPVDSHYIKSNKFTFKNNTSLKMSNGNRPFRVSIEGNIGSGKSTLLKYFEKFSDVDACAHYVQLTRLQMQTKLTEKKVQLFERSLQNNRYCFVEMARSKGFLSQHEFLAQCEWYDWIENNMDIGLDLIVYLRSCPKTVHERMLKRNRPEENCVPLEYLESLHKSYEHWLSANPPAPVLVLDVNQDLGQVQSLYTQNAPYILGKMPFTPESVLV
uniref:Deoxynucleoside kinase n=1 Tax=Cacopsylla melanoneura TaxID=428564 RepID=A0A8D8SPL4_9HEMI